MKHVHLLNMSVDELWLKSSNNKLAFKCLFEREFEKLFAYGLKIHQNKADVKDAIQDVFTDLWTKRKERLHINNIHTYLLKSVRYKLLKKAKDLKVIDIDRYHSEMYHSQKEETPNKDIALQQILLSMPKKQREVLHLKFFQGLTNPEIAEFLEMNTQSVANTLQRAYQSFRKIKAKKNLPN